MTGKTAEKKDGETESTRWRIKKIKNPFKRDERKKAKEDEDKETRIKHRVFDVDIREDKYQPNREEGQNYPITQGEQWQKRCVVEIKKEYPEANQTEIHARAEKIMADKLLTIANTAGKKWMNTPCSAQDRVRSKPEEDEVRNMDPMAPITSPMNRTEQDKANQVLNIMNEEYLSELLLRPVQVDSIMFASSIGLWTNRLNTNTQEGKKYILHLFRLMECHFQFALIQQSIIMRVLSDNIVRGSDWSCNNVFEDGNHMMWHKVGRAEFYEILLLRAYMTNLFREMIGYTRKLHPVRKSIISYDECLLAMKGAYTSPRINLWPRQLITGHPDFQGIVQCIPATFSRITTLQAIHKMKSYDLGAKEYMRMDARPMAYHTDLIIFAQESKNSMIPDVRDAERAEIEARSGAMTDYIPRDVNQQNNEPGQYSQQQGIGRMTRQNAGKRVRLELPEQAPTGAYAKAFQEMQDAEAEEVKRLRMGTSKNELPTQRTDSIYPNLSDIEEESMNEIASYQEEEDRKMAIFYQEEEDRNAQVWEEEENRKAARKGTNKTTLQGAVGGVAEVQDKSNFNPLLNKTKTGYRAMLNSVYYTDEQKRDEMMDIHTAALNEVAMSRDANLIGDSQYDVQRETLDRDYQVFLCRLPDCTDCLQKGVKQPKRGAQKGEKQDGQGSSSGYPPVDATSPAAKQMTDRGPTDTSTPSRPEFKPPLLKRTSKMAKPTGVLTYETCEEMMAEAGRKGTGTPTYVSVWPKTERITPPKSFHFKEELPEETQEAEDEEEEEQEEKGDEITEEDAHDQYLLDERVLHVKEKDEDEDEDGDKYMVSYREPTREKRLNSEIKPPSYSQLDLTEGYERGNALKYRVTGQPQNNAKTKARLTAKKKWEAKTQKARTLAKNLTRDAYKQMKPFETGQDPTQFLGFVHKTALVFADYGVINSDEYYELLFNKLSSACQYMVTNNHKCSTGDAFALRTFIKEVLGKRHNLIELSQLLRSITMKPGEFGDTITKIEDMVYRIRSTPTRKVSKAEFEGECAKVIKDALFIGHPPTYQALVLSGMIDPTTNIQNYKDLTNMLTRLDTVPPTIPPDAELFLGKYKINQQARESQNIQLEGTQQNTMNTQAQQGKDSGPIPMIAYTENMVQNLRRDLTAGKVQQEEMVRGLRMDLGNVKNLINGLKISPKESTISKAEKPVPSTRTTRNEASTSNKADEDEWWLRRKCAKCYKPGHTVYYCPYYHAIDRVTPLTENQKSRKAPENHACRMHTPPILGDHWENNCPLYEFVRNIEKK